MGYRIVRISGALWEQMFSEGYTFPTRDGERIRVTKGLPEGAKLVGVAEDTDSFCGQTFLLKFSHPSWEEQEPGERIPEARVEFSAETTTEFRPWMFDRLTD